MRRGARIAAISACGVAGLLCAVLLAGVPRAGADEGTLTTPTAPTTPAETTPTETTPAETTPPPTTGGETTPAPVPKPKPKPKSKPKPKPKPRGPRLITSGVTVGGTLVGGLTGAEARSLVKARFEKPLQLVVASGRKLTLEPRELGASMELNRALSLAVRVKRPAFIVPLKIDVKRARVESLVSRLAEEYQRDPVDARLKLRNLQPVATRERPGRRLQTVVATRLIVKALKTHERTPVPLPFEDLKPDVTSRDLGRVIVIRRGSNDLLLYRVGTKPKLIRQFKVATGRSEYPTPLGKFEIVTKQLNPWWYPPTTSAWAKGEEPVPPGPGNPLGTRWMGISSPYVGIHGTPDAASVGYSASHGCIRMLIPQVEWLFNQVEVGTPVFIVSA